MNRNKLMMFSVPLMIGCIIVGCGGSTSESDLIGKWELDPDVMEQALKDEGLEGEELKMGLMMLSSMSMIFEFKEDGTLMMSVSVFGESESESGEWKIRGYLHASSLVEVNQQRRNSKNLSKNEEKTLRMSGSMRNFTT